MVPAMLQYADVRCMYVAAGGCGPDGRGLARNEVEGRSEAQPRTAGIAAQFVLFYILQLFGE